MNGEDTKEAARIKLIINWCDDKARFYRNQIEEAEKNSNHGMARMHAYLEMYYTKKAQELRKVYYNHYLMITSPIDLAKLKADVAEHWKMADEDETKLKKLLLETRQDADIIGEEVVKDLTRKNNHLMNEYDRLLEKVNTDNPSIIYCELAKIHDHYEDKGAYNSKYMEGTIS